MRELQERRLKHASHLARRFFGFLRARPLRPPEQQWVHDRLASAELRALFFAQRHEDQRHAFEVAMRAGDVLSMDQLVDITGPAVSNQYFLLSIAAAF